MSLLFDFDNEQRSQKFVIGTDEAGRGPLAGPVVAAAVCFKEVYPKLIEELNLLNDSKKLTHKQREVLFEKIKKHACYSITVIDVEEIEQINILQAALKAMRISCENVFVQLADEAEVFVDGKMLVPKLSLKQTAFVKGDGKSASIAAASILAKVYRDKLMCDYAKQYPYYAWEQNKGYGTQKHIEAIKIYGITPLHRKSFLKNILPAKEEIQLMMEL